MSTPQDDQVQTLIEKLGGKLLQWFETRPGDRGYQPGVKIEIPADKFNGRGKILMISESDFESFIESAKRQAVEEALKKVDKYNPRYAHVNVEGWLVSEKELLGLTRTHTESGR